MLNYFNTRSDFLVFSLPLFFFLGGGGGVGGVGVGVGDGDVCMINLCFEK